MKKLLIAVSLATASCSVTTTTAPEPVAGVVVLRGTQALIIAHNAYQGVVAVVTPAVRSGMFNEQQLNRIAELNRQAQSLLSGAERGLTEAQRAQGVLDIVSQLWAMTRS